MVDAEGTDVRCKTRTSVLSRPGKYAHFDSAYIEGTLKTIPEDAVHANDPGGATKSSGKVRCENGGKTLVTARFRTAKNYS